MNCREDKWLWMCSRQQGGKRGSASSGEAQNETHFFGIREISHCALMGELTRNSDEKASALFEKYNVIYDKISWKVHIPYMETHCSVYLFTNFLQSMTVLQICWCTWQFFEKTGQVIFHPIGAWEMNRDVMNQSRLKGFKNSLELTIGHGQKVRCLQTLNNVLA